MQAEINSDPFPLPVPWLDGYYAIPSSFKLQKSKSFQSARIYGQDVSSGAAVAALLSNIYDIDSPGTKVESFVENTDHLFRVLDLCCCPGLKLCAIADTLYKDKKTGDLFGVDISEPRMSVCKRILQKYQIQPALNQTLNEAANDKDSSQGIRIKLFCNDGTKLAAMRCNDLNLVFDSTVSYEDEISRMGKRKRMNKSARARESKKLKEAGFLDRNNDQSSTLELFDRVLVDAECSTDGSIVHTHKRMLRCHGPQNATKYCIGASEVDVPLGVFDEKKLVELYALQRELAASGYQLLRKGGIMVYSTCSLSDQQNGQIVQWLLNTYPGARVVPLSFFPNSSLDESIDYRDVVEPGSIPGTIQFIPNIGNISVSVDKNRLFGGGFYIAKILKLFD